MTRRGRAISRWMLTVLMVGAGANHFLNPEPYVGMMPTVLPAPWTLVYVSGTAEIGALVVIFVVGIGLESRRKGEP